MREDICPICKRYVHNLDMFETFTIGKTTRVFHQAPCYDVFVKRLTELFNILTGPQEAFDAWLKEGS